ncbi:MAG TPA: DUF5703 family protein [Pseudonocardiaceae bacterium]
MSDGSVADDNWEYQGLRLPRQVSRRNAATVLSLQAEFGGWELSTVQMYSDGTRKVMLRRRRSTRQLPGLSV